MTLESIGPAVVQTGARGISWEKMLLWTVVRSVSSSTVLRTSICNASRRESECDQRVATNWRLRDRTLTNATVWTRSLYQAGRGSRNCVPGLWETQCKNTHRNESHTKYGAAGREAMVLLDSVESTNAYAVRFVLQRWLLNDYNVRRVNDEL